MSVSLVGIMIRLPIGLAMRAIMGEEKFEEWLRSDDYILETNFSDEKEMQKIVQKAGYDVVEWLGSLKTHFKDGNFFLWEEVEGKIVANMSINHDKEEINRFVSEVEKQAGRSVFSEAQSTEKIVPEKTIYKETFPSIYIDDTILIDILQQYGITVISTLENQIRAEYGNYMFLFTRNNSEDPFDICISSDSNNIMKLIDCFKSIDADYKSTLQENTYLYIKEQLKEEEMEIESEEVLEDNSIVITVSV